MNNIFGFEKSFLMETMMGPNSIRILNELLGLTSLPRRARVLDLGCGMGGTSIFLAKKYEAHVIAADLWIDPTDNFQRIRTFGLENTILPLSVEAHDMPFARGFFDAVISVDAYHYFGAQPGYLEAHILPLLKPGGIVAIAVPGLQSDFHDGIVPDVLKPFWQDDMHFYSAAWWKALWTSCPGIEAVVCKNLACHDLAWKDWLECDNPYAQEDRNMLAAEGGKYFSTIGMAARTSITERE